jgi:hypothetical protein
MCVRKIFGYSMHLSPLHERLAMATERHGPFTLGAGGSWYYWFNARPGDLRPRYLIPQPPSMGTREVEGVFVPEYWVGTKMFRVPEHPTYAAAGLSYRILVQNRSSVPQEFSIAAYVFAD